MPVLGNRAVPRCAAPEPFWRCLRRRLGEHSLPHRMNLVAPIRTVDGMTDIQARAYRAEDAAAVADLINTVGDAGGGPAGFTPAQLDEAVRNEVKDPAEDTRLLVDAGGRIVAAALVPLPSSGGDRLELIGAVHPDRRAAGIGRALLVWQLDRAAVRHAEVAPDVPWMAQVAAGVADESAIRLYERFGFSVARYFLAMTAPTTPPPV